MLTVLAVVVWVVCGVLAYGLSKGQLLKECLARDHQYTGEFEITNRIIFVMGPVSLVMLTVIFFFNGYGFDILCYRMPKELCARRS